MPDYNVINTNMQRLRERLIKRTNETLAARDRIEKSCEDIRLHPHHIRSMILAWANATCKWELSAITHLDKVLDLAETEYNRIPENIIKDISQEPSSAQNGDSKIADYWRTIKQKLTITGKKVHEELILVIDANAYLHDVYSLDDDIHSRKKNCINSHSDASPLLTINELMRIWEIINDVTKQIEDYTEVPILAQKGRQEFLKWYKDNKRDLKKSTIENKPSRKRLKEIEYKL